MHIVIVGPGALGSLVAARLALYIEKQGGKQNDDNDAIELSLLDYKEERARQINDSGLLLEEKGQSTTCKIRVETDPEVCSRCDVLFLCVKATSVESTLRRISPYLSSKTLFLAMENGIGHLDAVRDLFCIVGVGVTSEGATLVAPGHVRHGGAGMTRIGLLDEQSDDKAFERLSALAELLDAAGLMTVVTTHPLKYIWAKLFVNVAINALTAIHRCSNGDLLNSQETRETMKLAVNEAMAVAGALAIPIEGNPVTLALQVCESTANNISSMHQDVINSKPTEIDAINGAIVNLGKRLNIPTPVNTDLVRRVKEIESTYLQ